MYTAPSLMYGRMSTPVRDGWDPFFGQKLKKGAVVCRLSNRAHLRRDVLQFQRIRTETDPTDPLKPGTPL